MAGGTLLARIAADISPEQLLDVCGEEPTTECRWVLEQTGNEFLAHTADKVLSPIIQIVLIWVIAVIVNRLLRLAVNQIGRQIETSAESNRMSKVRARTPTVLRPTGSVSIRASARAKTTTAVLKSVATALTYTVAVLYTLSVVGLDLGPLFAGAGIAGVALGFGAQRMVQDFLSGVFMLLEDQFGVGDVIDVSGLVDGAAGVIGTVEEVTLRAISVRDVNGTIWHIPNGEIRRIGNMSQGWARALLDIRVPYGTDLDLAQQLIADVADEVTQRAEYRSEVLGAPEVWGVQELAPDAVLVRLVIKTRPGEQWAISRALRARLHDAFLEAGIQRPFAQHDIYIHEGPVSLSGAGPSGVARPGTGPAPAGPGGGDPQGRGPSSF